MIEELTLAGGLQVGGATSGDELETNDIDKPAPGIENTATANFQMNASRLLETYPELISLIKPSTQAELLSGDESEARARQLALLDITTEFGLIHQADSYSSDLIEDEITTSTSEPYFHSSYQINQDNEVEIDSNLALEANDKGGNNFKLGQLRHLQELDLGECQLTYIKWNAFKRLDSLKRLQLDGNHLR